jgi:hypothetical protein
MRTHRVTHDPAYHGLPLYQSADGHHTEILDRIITMLNHMCSRHNKVLFMRMDVRFPANPKDPSTALYPLDNEIFETFLTYYLWQLRQAYGDVLALWAREQNTTERQQHYHLVILMDGSKTQSIYGHMKLAEELWAFYLDLPSAAGLIDHCNREPLDCRPNGFQIRRGADDYQDAYAEAVRWSSYLAKAESKGLAPDGVREFGSSRIHPNTSGASCHDVDVPERFVVYPW